MTTPVTNAKTLYDRENVTPYIYQSGLFTMGTVKPIGWERWPELRLCVDTEDDLNVVWLIYTKLHKEGAKPFTLQSIVSLLKRYPNIITNAHVRQKD